MKDGTDSPHAVCDEVIAALKQQLRAAAEELTQLAASVDEIGDLRMRLYGLATRLAAAPGKGELQYVSGLEAENARLREDRDRWLHRYQEAEQQLATAEDDLKARHWEVEEKMRDMPPSDRLNTLKWFDRWLRAMIDGLAAAPGKGT